MNVLIKTVQLKLVHSNVCKFYNEKAYLKQLNGVGSGLWYR